MIGLVDAMGRGAVSRYRAGVWLLLVALLLGGVMAAAAEPSLATRGRTILSAAAGPGDDATLPDPKARNRGTPTEAAVPGPRARRSPPPAPHPGHAGLTATIVRRLEACRLPPCRPRPAPATTPATRRLAYDPHGPPVLAS